MTLEKWVNDPIFLRVRETPSSSDLVARSGGLGGLPSRVATKASA